MGEPHRPILLNLETSEGSGQACHPDVVYIKSGFGSGRWRYWMVCNPYPYKDNRAENPEIFVSYDGIFWAVPGGAQNPVAPSPPLLGDHNSDPDLLFHDGQLWLFYRETLRSKNPGQTPDINNIWLVKSQNGVRWSSPERVLSDATGLLVLSPAVVHIGGRFLMWSVEFEGGALQVVRRSSSDGLSWGERKTSSVVGLEAGRQPWHIDVIAEGDRFSAALVSCMGLGRSAERLHYAHSEDGGETWVAEGYLLEQIYEFEANLQYRASLRRMNELGPQYEMWYSCASMADVFSIAYVRLVRDGNRLIPGIAEEVKNGVVIGA